MPPHRRYSVSPTPTTHTRSRTGAQHRPRPPGLSTATAACDELSRGDPVPRRAGGGGATSRGARPRPLPGSGGRTEGGPDAGHGGGSRGRAGSRRHARGAGPGCRGSRGGGGGPGRAGGGGGADRARGRGGGCTSGRVEGTAAFGGGLPLGAVCIGVLRGADPVAGVVHLPAIGETYSAADGIAWWNGQRLPPLGGLAGEGDRFILTHAKAHLRHRITYSGKVRSLGSTAYHVVLVARGAAEAALLGHAHLWDLAGPGAVLAAVGGRYEYLGGDAVDLGALVDGRRAPDYILTGGVSALA